MKTHDPKAARWAIAGTGVCFVLASGMAVAQTVTTIKTDASWGRTAQTLTPGAGNTIVTGNQGATYAIPGKVYTITETQGKLAGANLFHSFESFSIGTGDAAIFTTTTPTLNNVVSRVSGTSPSMINGLLALVPAAGSNPSFFFINPNGVTFGAGAQVDVPAAFHVSTADHLRFADGTLFKAGNGSDSTLSIAPPEAFGFLGTRRAPVNVVEGTVISTWPGAPVSIAAGDILVDGAGIVTGAAGIRLAAVGQTQVDVPLVGPLPSASGNLIVRNGAQIVAYNWDPLASANLEVSAGNILIDGGGVPSGLFTYSLGAGNAGNIVANVQDTLYIFSSGQILSSTISTGGAGSVIISAQNILLDRAGAPSFTGIGSQTDPGSTGNASTIDLTVADTLALFAGAQINASSFGAGDTGSVRVSTGTFYIDGTGTRIPTGIGIQSLGTGNGTTTGRIDVTVRNDLTILNGGNFSSSSFTSRDGGSISVRAGNITLQGNDASGGTGFFTDTEASGRGGDLNVAASGDITILVGAEISAATFGSGDAGALKLTAHNLLIDGTGSRFFTGVSGNASIPSTGGNAGSVSVTVSDSITIRNGGEIASSTFSSGNAGSIEVSARNIAMDGTGSPLFTGISSDAAPGSSGGHGGNVKVTAAENLYVITGSEIATSTFSTGNAGSIEINAGNILINANNGQSTTGIFSNTYGAGQAGSLSINATGDINIQSRGKIATDTFSSGNGGSIVLTAQNVTIEGLNSSIAAQSEISSTASQAGSIKINVEDAFTLLSGGFVSTSTLSAANAGSIEISAHSVLVSGLASIVQSTTQAAGQGGSILISASQMRVEQLGDINAEASGTGNAGNITMTGDSLAVMSGGRVEASTFGAGKGGSIAIAVTGDVTVAGVAIIGQTAFHSGLFAGTQIDPIAGSATIAIPGSGGDISIGAKNVVLGDGGQIDSSTTSGGAGGNVSITARQNFTVAGANTRVTSDAAAGDGPGGNILISASQMTVEQAANITAETSGKGKAGNVTLTGDQLSVLSGGRIEASTSGAGNGGSIAVTVTGDVIVSGVDPNSQTDSRSGLFAKTQSPSTGTGGGGGGGTGGGGTGGGGTGGGAGAPKPGSAGNISIAANNLLLNDGAQIDSSTTSGGAGGSVAITARGNITIAGTDTRLTSDATRGDGPGGNITMVAKNITISDGASVTAATGGKGDAGNINLTTVDQLLLQSGAKVTTSTSGAGKGGSVVIQAARVLLDGADTAIVADTLRPFANLTITINILHGNDGDLIVQLQSPTGTRIALLSRVGGSGDNFIDTTFDDQATKPITAGSAAFTGTFNPREPLSQLINELTAGNWVLNVRDQATGNTGTLQNWTLQIGQQTFQSTGGPLPIPDNGSLQSTITVTNPTVPTIQGTGQATGIGGDVFVNAGSLTVQNGATMSAITRGTGAGGIVNLQVAGDISILNNARIATDTLGSGRAGDVLVNARNLVVNHGEISSNSSGASSGDAGRIGIDVADTLSLLRGGSISSTTQSMQGAAGSIDARARQILVDGQGSAFLAGARANSSGQTGSLTLNATDAITLSNAGILSIRNEATALDPGAVTPTLISVSAPNITLKDASITAESRGNLNASDIRIHFTGNLHVDPSSITTSAFQGNGGSIDIGGGRMILLQDSQITTSVLGSLGNGGDIRIQADSMVMQSGFIQANTAGAGASGGNVVVDVRTLLPSGNSLFVGGSNPFVFQAGVSGPNVIQAAAPTGVSGTINSTSPTLDVAGSLNGLTANVAEFGALGQDLCRIGARSSFTPVGRGGLRPRSAGMIRPEGTASQTATRDGGAVGFVAVAQEIVPADPNVVCRY